MTKEILISGVLGGAVMFVVMLTCRFLLPGAAYPELRAMPGQVQMHAALKERITEPGTYVCPYLPPNERSSSFPNYLNEPVFAVTYTGYTHGTVPGFASVGILSFLLAPTAAAWLLSQASDRVLTTYVRRVVYVATLGLLIAVSADLLLSFTAEKPLLAVAWLAGVRVITWTAAGLVVAWRVKPISP